MTQTIRTHVPVLGLGPDCDVHCRLSVPELEADVPNYLRPLLRGRERLTWLGVYSHTRQAWIFPCTQQSVTAALAAAKVVLR